MNAHPRVALGAAALAWVAGCGGRELSGPPELRPGRDECAECGMLIHDERSASALLVERGGRRAHLLFDDIGCMLDHEEEAGRELSILDRYAHDHQTRAWVGTGGAAFLMTGSDRLHTPMGSGIAAFADVAGAEVAQRELGGEIMAYPALAAARRAWLEAGLQRTPPGGP